MEEELSVLVVDDQLANRDILKRRLKKLNLSVICAENGIEALKTLAKEKISLVLLDIMMPEMDGIETLKRIKGDALMSSIPIVMISALDEVGCIAECIQLGAEDYLPKPFKAEILNARVLSCLEKKRLLDQEQKYLAQIEKEKKRSEVLLHTIFPKPVIEELEKKGTFHPVFQEDVAILFVDVVDFTSYCQKVSPEEIVENLTEMIEGFEEIVEKYKIEEIKKMGDAILCASGLWGDIENPVLESAECAREMIERSKGFKSGWEVRVGLHSGDIIVGLVGYKKPMFDVWGDTVNTAARLQVHATPNRINVSEKAWDAISHIYEPKQICEKEVRGKGKMKMIELGDKRQP